jgi:hypothetical protein
VETSDDEFSQFPVESIARFLTVCGREDPALLRRSTEPPAVDYFAQFHMRAAPLRHSSSSPLPPVGDASDQDKFLEALVAIAVTSARQAEDTLQQMRAATAAARRRLFSISALGAAGLVLVIASVSGSGFNLDISGLFPKHGTIFASVEHQSSDPDAIAVGQPPPVIASVRQPTVSRLLGGPHDPAMTPRAAEPAAPSASADLTGHQSLESMLHENAARVIDTAPVRARPLPPVPSHIIQVSSAPAESKHDAPPTSASIRATEAPPTRGWQLVAAVRELEALTDPASTSGAGSLLAPN